MNFICNKLAASYAHAFLDIFGDSITLDSLAALRKAALFFKQYQRRLALVLAPYIDKKRAIEQITIICEAAGVPSSCKHIIKLLAHHNRLDIVTDVLFQIGEQYKIRHHIANCSITTSHELTEHERAIITTFLEKKNNNTFIQEYNVDTKLIAGIRIVGDNVFWEYSIRHYLEKIYCKLIR